MLKIKFLTIVLMIFLVAVLLTVTGCGQENSTQESLQEVNTQNIAQNVIQEVSLSKIDISKGIVYSAFEKDYDYFGDDIKIQIPAVNINTDTIVNLNEAIMNKYQQDIENNEEFASQEITYEYFENGNILSIVIKQTALEASIENYDVYNVNIETVESLSKEDILQQKNIATEAYVSKIKTQLVNEFETNFASQVGTQFYETQKEKTSSDENCSLENTEIYIGENGHLHYIANIYSLAGADKYQNEFDYGE